MKNFKKLLCVCLIACICLCAVGCNKNTDTNSSGLSSTIANSNKNELESTKDEKLELYHQFTDFGGQIKKEEVGEKLEELTQAQSNYPKFLKMAEHELGFKVYRSTQISRDAF